MPDEERPTVPAIHPYAKVGRVRAAEMECSDTCANHPCGCAVCDGEIMYAPAEE